MDGQHKQRWVGVILLLLLAAMLAPFVFRSPEQVRLALDMEAPQPPPVASVEPDPATEASERNQVREQIEGERQAVRESGRANLVEEPDGEGKDDGEADADPKEEPPLSGWSVQVASFSKRDNAAELKQSLNDAGYTAYQREGTNEEGESLHRVFVGPELERADARELKRRIALDETFELEGLVVPYHP